MTHMPKRLKILRKEQLAVHRGVNAMIEDALTTMYLKRLAERAMWDFFAARARERDVKLQEGLEHLLADLLEMPNSSPTTDEG